MNWLDKIKNVKTIAGIFLTCVSVAAFSTMYVKTLAADAKQANEKADRLGELVVRQQTLLEVQADRTDMMFQLYVTMDREDIDHVRSLPTTMPVDASGSPIIGSEWLNIAEYDSTVIYGTDTIRYGFPKIGQVITLTDTGKVVIYDLWDLR